MAVEPQLLFEVRKIDPIYQILAEHPTLNDDMDFLLSNSYIQTPLAENFTKKLNTIQKTSPVLLQLLYIMYDRIYAVMEFQYYDYELLSASEYNYLQEMLGIFRFNYSLIYNRLDLITSDYHRLLRYAYDQQLEK